MESINEIVKAFCLSGHVKEIVPFGNGHINDTYRVVCTREAMFLRELIMKYF